MEARIKRTGKMIYSAETNDLSNEVHCWFSDPDGTSPNCAFVMDNKQFAQMLKNGEVEIIDNPGTRLTLL
jgi:hypothetical protein